MKLRHRERLALGLALALATVVFEHWPGVDLWASAAFHGPAGFVGDEQAWVRGLYRAIPWLGDLVIIGTVALCLAPLLRRGWIARWRWRRAMSLLGCIVFAVGLVVHAGLKDHWGRPRPDQVSVFGGPVAFQPALHPSSLCPRNCSFVSGHASAGFALMAIGALGTAATRRRWWLVGMACGTLFGLARVMQGRHFFSDIVFCALVVWLCTVLLRELWMRARVLRLRRRAAAG